MHVYQYIHQEMYIPLSLQKIGPFEEEHLHAYFHQYQRFFFWTHLLLID